MLLHLLVLAPCQLSITSLPPFQLLLLGIWLLLRLKLARFLAKHRPWGTRPLCVATRYRRPARKQARRLSQELAILARANTICAREDALERLVSCMLGLATREPSEIIHDCLSTGGSVSAFSIALELLACIEPELRCLLGALLGSSPVGRAHIEDLHGLGDEAQLDRLVQWRVARKARRVVHFDQPGLELAVHQNVKPQNLETVGK
mmetsp:Transcript_18987/g.54365  ORF Transcript_18987/g.54365 Transcript_18987/m.54365 type:complete len:206 (+) Transcript_18987:755-1372(+)